MKGREDRIERSRARKSGDKRGMQYKDRKRTKSSRTGKPVTAEIMRRLFAPETMYNAE
jgi:hypothetical protein